MKPRIARLAFFKPNFIILAFFIFELPEKFFLAFYLNQDKIVSYAPRQFC